MTNPLDTSDLANLVLADWHEEYGDIDYANEIRESVLEPRVNGWHWNDDGDDAVGCHIGSSSGVGGSIIGYCVGAVVIGDCRVGGHSDFSISGVVAGSGSGSSVIGDVGR